MDRTEQFKKTNNELKENINKMFNILDIFKHTINANLEILNLKSEGKEAGNVEFFN